MLRARSIRSRLPAGLLMHPRAGREGNDSGLCFMSGSSSFCMWKDPKAMINFYLVLFYVTLLMLSRQVGREARRPVLSGAAELGWGRRLGGAQKTRQPWSPGQGSPSPHLPASPPLRMPVTFGHTGHLRTESQLTGILRPRGGGR